MTKTQTKALCVEESAPKSHVTPSKGKSTTHALMPSLQKLDSIQSCVYQNGTSIQPKRNPAKITLLLPYLFRMVVFCLLHCRHFLDNAHQDKKVYLKKKKKHFFLNNVKIRKTHTRIQQVLCFLLQNECEVKFAGRPKNDKSILG